MLLSKDKPPERYLLLVVAVFYLALMVWYPLFISNTGWGWHEPIDASGTVSRLLGSLLTYIAMWVLFEPFIRPILRFISDGGHDYRRNKEAMEALVGLYISYHIVPKIVASLNFAVSVTYNAFIVLVLFALPAIISLLSYVVIDRLVPTHNSQ